MVLLKHSVNGIIDIYGKCLLFLPRKYLIVQSSDINIRKKCEISLKLIIKTPEHIPHFEQINVCLLD